MHLTPLDIYQREFSRKKIGGLDENEVYDFLKKVGREYEALYAECKNLKEQNQRLTNQMKDYLELEKTLKQTLIAAQKSSAETKNNAEKEAEWIIKEAEIQAERILDEARSEVEMISKEIRELKRQKRMLKVELRTVLESYLAMLNEEPPILSANNINTSPSSSGITDTSASAANLSLATNIGVAPISAGVKPDILDMPLNSQKHSPITNKQITSAPPKTN